jgi:hypothetical protein
MHMKEAGYNTALMRILLSKLTGKGDVLVGIPSEWIGASSSGGASPPLPWIDR